MKVGFVETMRGSVVTPSGDRTNLEFEVSAHAPHLRQFLKDGKTQITGIMRAGLYAREAPATGTLVIDLPRSLTYSVDFQSGGARYRLAGKKTPSVFSPLKSMSAMDVVLEKDGLEIARGQMAFDLRELPGFIASWLPFHARPRLHLDVRRRLLERSAMDAPT